MKEGWIVGRTAKEDEPVLRIVWYGDMTGRHKQKWKEKTAPCFSFLDPKQNNLMKILFQVKYALTELNPKK